MNIRAALVACLVLVVSHGLSAGFVDAGPGVEVVVSPKAPALEKMAAEEMAALLTTLFEAETQILERPSGKLPAALIGSPATNPAMMEYLDFDWPKLSDQGHLLRSIEFQEPNQPKQTMLVVGGGSPVATLWAVYELGQRWGMRYTAHGDKIPPDAPEFTLSGFNQTLEPIDRQRIWRTVNDFPIGPESWGLKEQKAMLRQLAKLKYNRVMISVWPWQPFVDYEFRGVRKQTATLFFGEKFPVEGDVPGRAAFGGAEVFTNPDFANADTYEEMTVAGKKYLQGIIDEAHRLGMTVGLSISPLEFPKEFAAVLPEAPQPHGLEKLVIGPGPKQTPSDPLFRELVRTKVRAYIETYPDIDQISFTMPEFPDWVAHAEESFASLDKKLQLGDDISYEAILQAARERGTIASGDRGESSVKGNITALDFLHNLDPDGELLVSPSGKQMSGVLTALDPALFPVADQLVPEHIELLHFVDYTARRVVKNKALLAKLPESAAKRSLIILTLADDNVGVLPQLATSDIHALLQETRKLGFTGYSTRYWLVGDLDPTLHYLTRAACDAEMTPTAAYNDLIDGICGPGVSQRTTLGFEAIEKATAIIDEHDLGFAFPVSGMVMKHYRSDPAPEWWEEATAAYTEAMVEMYRGQSHAGKAGRNYILYHAKRHEFAVTYFAAITALRAAADAKKQGETDALYEQLEIALESIYNATHCIGEVAVSNSDRGLIAVMAKYGYRPLIKEFERLEAEE